MEGIVMLLAHCDGIKWRVYERYGTVRNLPWNVSCLPLLFHQFGNAAFSSIFDSITGFVSLPPPSYIHLFLRFHSGSHSSAREMPSLKPSESKEDAQKRVFSILCPNPILFISPTSGCWKCVRVCVRMITCKAQLFKGLHCMSLVLASIGILIKGLSSLCPPGSSSLTRVLGHQRGAVGG